MIKHQDIGNILLVSCYNKKHCCLLDLIHMTLTMKEGFIFQHYHINQKVSLISHNYY